MFHFGWEGVTVGGLMAPARTFPGLVHASALRFASRIAIEDAQGTLTFSELERTASRASAAFIALGIQRGDRVAIWAPNCREWILAALGASMAGGVLVPVNTRFKGAEAGYSIETSRARILCTVGEFLGTSYMALLLGEYGEGTTERPVAGLANLEQVVLLEGSRANALDWSAFLARGEGVETSAVERRAAEVSPDDLSDILFTSGTTGHPKGVTTTHEQNLRAFTSWTEVVGLREGDRYLIVNPFFHAFGYKAGWLACLLRGATILPHAVFDVPAVLARIAEDRVTVLPGPPTLYQSILAHPDLARYDLSGLRLAVTGAASIPVELIRRMKSELGFDTIITGYGLTEACGIATMCRFDDDPETIATTSGRAIPDVEVRIAGEDGGEVPRGEPGEVVIRGYNVMRGYFEDPGQTSEVIDEHGWLHTGDIGVMDERGYLRITDRKKDMFIVGGFNCYPAEIENLMCQNQDIAQVAIVGVPDERLGEVAVAFVVLRPGLPAMDPGARGEELTRWCRAHMANYKVPRRVELVLALPLNAAGKVTKFVLRERARELGLAQGP
jgi:acyl-CoA synthetase (AMP-forming)/AMP-acid ligase II